MYKVWTTNFGVTVYEGNDQNKAIDAAVRTGFECTMTYPDGMMRWSPISGWATVYSQNDDRHINQFFKGW